MRYIQIKYQKLSTFYKDTVNRNKVTVDTNTLDLESVAQIESMVKNEGVLPMKEGSIEVISNPNLLQEVENFLVTHQESVLNVIEYLIHNVW